jgi:hypothetical protein
MAITPTNSLLTALSGLGLDGARPRPTHEASRPAPPPAQGVGNQAGGNQATGNQAAGNQATGNRAAGPDPSRPLPRGSLVNIVV